MGTRGDASLGLGLERRLSAFSSSRGAPPPLAGRASLRLGLERRLSAFSSSRGAPPPLAGRASRGLGLERRLSPSADWKSSPAGRTARSACHSAERRSYPNELRAPMSANTTISSRRRPVRL